MKGIHGSILDVITVPSGKKTKAPIILSVITGVV